MIPNVFTQRELREYRKNNCYICGCRLAPVGNSLPYSRIVNDYIKKWVERGVHDGCWYAMDKDDRDDYRYKRRVYIVVAAKDEDDAKDWGARWDPERELWYATSEYNHTEYLSAYTVVDTDTYAYI